MVGVSVRGGDSLCGAAGVCRGLRGRAAGAGGWLSISSRLVRFRIRFWVPRLWFREQRIFRRAVNCSMNRSGMTGGISRFTERRFTSGIKQGYIPTTLEVERGNGTVNVWRVPVDSSSYLYPKAYAVRVDAVNLNYSVPCAAAMYNLTGPDGSILTPKPTPTYD